MKIFAKKISDAFLKNSAGYILAAGTVFLLFLGCVYYKFGVAPSFGGMGGNIQRIRILYALTVVIGLVFEGVVVFFLFYRKKLHIEKIAVLTVAFWGLLFMFLLPPGTAPDEDKTYTTSYALSNNLMFSAGTDENNFVRMRAEDADMILHRAPGWDDYVAVSTGFFERCDEQSKEMVVCSMERQNIIFWAFLPQAIGITIARILGMGQIFTLFMGRFVNFVMFLVCFWFAMKRMPSWGKYVLFVISVFPMTLQQVSSMSYDAMVLGLSFYFVSLVFQLAYEKEKVTGKDIACMVGSMAILAPLKVIYCFFALLCFLIPREKFGTKKRYWIAVAAMFVAVCVTILGSQSSRFAEYIKGSNNTITYKDPTENQLVTQEQAEQDGVIVHEEELYTFSWAFHHPKEMLLYWGNTIRLQGYEYADQIFGKKLGWLEIEMPSIIIYGILALFLSTFVRREEDPVPPVVHKVNYIAVFLIIATLSYLFMFVGHTRAVSLFCEGVQGRYFLPAVILVPFIFWRDSLVLKRTQAKKTAEEKSTHRTYDLVRLWCAGALLFWTTITIFERVVVRLGSNMVGK